MITLLISSLGVSCSVKTASFDKVGVLRLAEEVLSSSIAMFTLNKGLFQHVYVVYLYCVQVCLMVLEDKITCI